MLGRPDGFERWALVLAGIKEHDSSHKRMSRETRLSYNTVKKNLGYLEKPADYRAPAADEAGGA